ncbi:RNA polymerase sigma factor [Gloeobacter morelensis]|uniref:Sigma-70 family RNA polymerase sigma factor n=1 Tax=Gloeobacter morelensis MG652769 TaxID=2781736 RepID=A0ABY3PSI1_9CYAN|nr:sigma-70 family RNA polymerase sigma factor [Gloeobacter morelensis]UFP96683.1 sigma-70 family RNA polymerase sigma factor [Gloeobacter morelensis MG652769]
MESAVAPLFENVKQMAVTDLDRLAGKLKPLLRQREASCCNRDYALSARLQAVEAADGALREAGLNLFVEEVARFSRAFLRRKDFWQLGSRPLDAEDFVMEVLIRLTTGELDNFDPARAGFGTWLKATVLRTTFAELKRRDNPYWGRSRNLGLRAERSRTQAQALANPASLNTPLGQGGDAVLQDVLVSRGNSPDFELLEEQCACRFRQAIEALTPEEQVLIERAYAFDESHERIARSLGVTRAAVTRRLGRIRNRLVALLGESFCHDCDGTRFAKEIFGDPHDEP